MSRRHPQRIGRPPEEPKVLAAVPELHHPVFQAQSLDLIRRLIAVLHQIDPPAAPGPFSNGRGTYQFKYNAKVFPTSFLLRSYNGAGRPILLDDLRVLTSAADWEQYARRIKQWLDDEHNGVMEQQDADRTYNWIQKMSKGEEQTN